MVMTAEDCIKVNGVPVKDSGLIHLMFECKFDSLKICKGTFFKVKSLSKSFVGQVF